MRKTILLITLLSILSSCSKEEEHPCYQITDKQKVYKNNTYIYYLTLNDYGLMEVSKSDYEGSMFEIGKNYCIGKPNY